MPDTENAPSLLAQTMELGKTLKEIADGDPNGSPSERAARVFSEWVRVAGPGSRKPDYFADVADNYLPQENSNRDLQDLFNMLQSYIEVDDEDFDDEEPPKTFINLPLLG